MTYLPPFLRKRLTGRHNLQNIIDNTGWIFLDKLLRMGGSLVVGVLVARYLGPEQYGILNYAAAFVALLGTLATLGLEGIVVRDLVKTPLLTNELMGSSFFLKLTGGVITVVLSIVAIFLIKPNDQLVRLVVCIISLSLIFQAFESIEFFYKAKVKSKYSIIAKNIAFLLSTVVRVWSLIAKASLVTFVWISLAETICGSLLLVMVYRMQGQTIFEWKFDITVTKRLLTDSWPLILSGIVIMIYMRIDQIMLGEMIGNSSVGTYSAALRLSETWYFVPLSIVSSLGPSIINSKKISEEFYLERLQKLYNTMTLISVSIAIVVSLFSGTLVHVLYGNQFKGAGDILAIHIWSAVFYFMGVAGSQWFLIENLQKYAFYRTVLGAIVNILLNLVLIPKFGGVGAATATLISQGIASYLSNGLNPKTIIVFRMQSKSLLNFLTFRTITELMKSAAPQC